MGRKCCSTFAPKSEKVISISNESRRSTLKMICCGMILQKLVLGINLILMKEPRREQFEELVEVYPMTQEGNEIYSRHVLVYVVQLIGGIALLTTTLCILKKKPAI